ncbi:sensor histidine kinase [Amycolatopsis sp.]|uniref:sensor histidine kinase n=1 Tax=Amycolatopsis sp. TaxID=37632 RepID=UPI002DFD95A4|nr:sensor histidine kinase [Amycolatopsis sp.]
MWSVPRDAGPDRARPRRYRPHPTGQPDPDPRRHRRRPRGTGDQRSRPGAQAPQAARVFDRFYRADSSRSRSTGGAGLGLSIALSLVTAHGGVLELHTTPGEGATFRLALVTLTGRADSAREALAWESAPRRDPNAALGALSDPNAALGYFQAHPAL